jgi:hypothetical protein
MIMHHLTWLQLLPQQQRLLLFKQHCIMPHCIQLVVELYAPWHSCALMKGQQLQVTLGVL